jgi:hypothetical protein
VVASFGDHVGRAVTGSGWRVAGGCGYVQVKCITNFLLVFYRPCLPGLRTVIHPALDAVGYQQASLKFDSDKPRLWIVPTVGLPSHFPFSPSSPSTFVPVCFVVYFTLRRL